MCILCQKNDLKAMSPKCEMGIEYNNKRKMEYVLFGYKQGMPPCSRYKSFIRRYALSR